MRFFHDARIIDKCYWECVNKQYRCNGIRFIRQFSHFENSHLSLPKLIRLAFYSFIGNHTIKDTMKNLSLANDTVVHHYLTIE